MARRMIIMLGIAAVVLGGIFGFEAYKSHMIAQYMASQAFPPQAVSTALATAEPWQKHIEAVGSLRAINGADLSAQVAGIVSAIHGDSGAEVKEGTLLVEFQAADEIAKLNSLKAQAALARITYERDQRQLKAQGVSQQTVDADEQTLKSDEAQVAAQQATVDYKVIRAPFSGKLGIRMADVGQYLPAGTPIFTLQSIDPIYVDFYLPQQDLDDVKVGQPIQAVVDTYPAKRFPGEISAINAKVDAATRNIQVRATLKNNDHLLLPGMYATVEIDAGTPERHVTLPQTAIIYSPSGNSVYVVEDKGKDDKGQEKLIAHQALVMTGATRGDQVAVLKGVKEGDTVVTAGQIKLREGAPIVVNNTVKPPSEANPTPVDQ